jgi:hypothetical protein
VRVARERGYYEASHIRWIGKAGWKDWQLKDLLLDNDWVLVTRNSRDFRGSSRSPGFGGQFADVPLHPGLICINGPATMDLELQIVLFERALDELDIEGDMTNRVLEINWKGDGVPVEVVRYDLPKAQR